MIASKFWTEYCKVSILLIEAGIFIPFCPNEYCIPSKEVSILLIEAGIFIQILD